MTKTIERIEEVMGRPQSRRSFFVRMAQVSAVVGAGLAGSRLLDPLTAEAACSGPLCGTCYNCPFCTTCGTCSNCVSCSPTTTPSGCQKAGCGAASVYCWTICCQGKRLTACDYLCGGCPGHSGCSCRCQHTLSCGGLSNCSPSCTSNCNG